MAVRGIAGVGCAVTGEADDFVLAEFVSDGGDPGLRERCNGEFISYYGGDGVAFIYYAGEG